MDQLSDLVDQIDTKVSDLKEHRDKRLAHTNLDYAMSRIELPGLSVEMVEDILKDIRQFMNVIDQEREPDTIMMYDHPHVLGDGTAFVEALKRAKRLTDLQIAAWGEMSADQIAEELRQRTL